MNLIYPNEIPTDKKHYTPALNGCRHLFLSARSEEESIKKAVEWFGESWEELKVKGWKIEGFWGSEYE